MKTSLKALVAAVAFCAAGSVQAAIDTDNVGGGNNLTLGTGDGELFFTVYDKVRQQSMIFDLNLTVNDFRNNNAALINTFSRSDTGLQNFIAGGNAADMKWNIGGISNKGFGPDIGIVTTHGNAGATIDASELPISGSALTSAMTNAEFYAEQNNSFLGSGNTYASSATASTGYLFGTWADSFGGALFFSNTAALGDLMLMSFIHLDGSGDLDPPPLVQAFADGFWKLDAAAGSVSYVSSLTPIPLPPALWLLGASLVGLVGVARRRKDESDSSDNAVVA